MTSGIYQIINSVNNKCYVGSSKNIEKRLQEHCKGRGNVHLWNSIKKYGIRNFETTILKKCKIAFLILWEQKFIDLLHPEYNKSNIAGKVEFTQEIKAKLSIAQIGNKYWLERKHTKETCIKMSAMLLGNKHWLGHKHSEKSRIKMSAAKIGNQYSLNCQNFLGHKHTIETRAKMKKAQQKRRKEEKNINAN